MVVEASLIEATPLPLSTKRASMTADHSKLYESFAAGDKVIKRTAKGIRKQYQRAYVAELNNMLRLFGCTRSAALVDSTILKEIKDFADTSADSIVKTFNRNLANEVLRTDVTNKRSASDSIRAWKKKRQVKKRKQITQWTIGSAIKAADSMFVKKNRHILDFSKMEARLHPRKAKESVCLGWMRRGWFSMLEAVDNAPPYHLNCPHFFKFRVTKLSAADRVRLCPLLWVGGI